MFKTKNTHIDWGVAPSAFSWSGKHRTPGRRRRHRAAATSWRRRRRAPSSGRSRGGRRGCFGRKACRCGCRGSVGLWRHCFWRHRWKVSSGGRSTPGWRIPSENKKLYIFMQEWLFLFLLLITYFKFFFFSDFNRLQKKIYYCKLLGFIFLITYIFLCAFFTLKQDKKKFK